MPGRPDISPDLRVGQLLDAYPELEPVLVELAPPFQKLRNPVLRRTVARITTLRQAAKVAGVPLERLLDTLRAAARAEPSQEYVASAEAARSDDNAASPNHAGDVHSPAWASADSASQTVDADALLAAGENPLAVVQKALAGVSPGTVVCIVSTFRPEPLINALERAGHAVHVMAAGEASFRVLVRMGGPDG